MRRAQMEMMGFVMVVILITVGMFFTLTFKQPEPEKRAITVYSDEKLASNFLITLLETDVQENIKVHDLAVDCVRAETGMQARYNNPCTAVEAITETILDKTLKGVYSYNLTFTYTDADNNRQLLITLADGACLGARSAPGIQPISLFRVTTGTAVMRLDICT